ncbi:hypothetical protein [uncultured Microbacterium sp.]|uniref:hypothetical protein n=1 Tax=uncultured Microbacterium sp. TaxID=191216 RepID=UPI0028DC7A28|nr:hypothetical protein [uncultured Microbacterium sp.]
MTSRRATLIAWTLAAVLVGAGLLMTIVGVLTPVSFGWFAYQPESSATFSPEGNVVILTRTAVMGAAVLGLGLIALAFLMGVRRGDRRSRATGTDAVGD